MEYTLSDVVELWESCDYEDANRLLATGWVLLNTHTQNFGYSGEPSYHAVYVLGWPRSKGDAPPNPYKKKVPAKPKTAREEAFEAHLKEDPHFFERMFGPSPQEPDLD